jgi:uncharacterized protein (TIGR03067 family)
MRRWNILATVLLGTAAVGSADDKPSDDGEKLAGKWKVVEAVRDGETLKDVPPALFEWVKFGGPKPLLHFELPAKLVPAEITGEYVAVGHTLDPKADPKRITLTRNYGGKGFSYPGIYELRGDRLRMCLALNDWYAHTAARKVPDKFEAPKGSGRTLVVFERVKE